MDNDFKVGHSVDMLVITLQSIYRELGKSHSVEAALMRDIFLSSPVLIASRLDPARRIQWR